MDFRRMFDDIFYYTSIIILMPFWLAAYAIQLCKFGNIGNK